MDSLKNNRMLIQPVKRYFLERIGIRKCQRIALPVGVHLVGRSRLAHVFIKSKFCSRILCRIIVDSDSISVCVDGEKRIGGVYLNDVRHKRGKVVLRDGDKIGFGTPTNLSAKCMADYGNKVHVYKVQCTTAQQTSNGNNYRLAAKWTPSSVPQSQQHHQHEPVPPLPPQTTVSMRPPKHDSAYCQDANHKMPPAVTDASTTESSIKSNAVSGSDAEMLNETENRRKVVFSEFANVRLYDPEDFSHVFLDGDEGDDDKDTRETATEKHGTQDLQM